MAATVALPFIRKKLTVPAFSMVGCDPLMVGDQIFNAFQAPTVMSLDIRGMD